MGFPACGSPPCFVLSCRAVWSSGVFCVLCAAFIFALTALLVKLTGGRVPVLEITLYRSAISLVVSAGKRRITRNCSSSGSWSYLVRRRHPTTPAAINSSSLSPQLAIPLNRFWLHILFVLTNAAIIKGKSITPVMGHRRNVKWLIPRGVFGALLAHTRVLWATAAAATAAVHWCSAARACRERQSYSREHTSGTH